MTLAGLAQAQRYLACIVESVDMCCHLPADAVDVGVWVEGEVKVDDVGDVVEVYSPRNTRLLVLLPPTTLTTLNSH